MKTILLVLLFGLDGNLTFVTHENKTEKQCIEMKARFKSFEYSKKEFNGFDVKCVDRVGLIGELDK